MKQEFIAINKKLILDMDDIIDIEEITPNENYTVILPNPYDKDKCLYAQRVFITHESYKAFKKRKSKKDKQVMKNE